MADDPDLWAALAEVLHCEVEDLPKPRPYTFAEEERMSHAADTYDPETGRSAPLLPGRRRV